MTTEQQDSQIKTAKSQNEYESEAKNSDSAQQLKDKSNYRSENAISKGKKQLNEDQEENQVTIELPEENFNKVKKIADALGLSVENVIDSAIKYANFYVNETKINIKKIRDLKEFPKSENNHGKPKKQILKLFPEIEDSLNKLEMKDHPDHCAIFGINLLFENLVNSIISSDVKESN